MAMNRHIQFQWHPDPWLWEHIGKHFPLAIEDRGRVRRCLRPFDRRHLTVGEVQEYFRKQIEGPVDLNDTQVVELRSRLLCMDGVQFWAWVMEDGEKVEVYV